MIFHLVNDFHSAFELETASYPPDEAASLDTLAYRHKNAPELFLGAYTEENVLIAFINSTRSSSLTLTHESMKVHEPTGQTVCIHSVCVHQQYRRNGIATRLLKEYVKRIRLDTTVKRIALIAHQELIPLYEKCDFTLFGPSNVQHGKLLTR